MPAADIHRLAIAIRSAIGIEALVWLTDVAGLSRADAIDLMRWSARAILAAALNDRRAQEERRGRGEANTTPSDGQRHASPNGAV